MESDGYSADRKLKLNLTHSVVLIIILAIAAYKATKDSVVTSLIATCFVTSVFIMVFLLCDVMLRLCHTLVSLADASEQYGESLASLVSHNFALTTASATTVVISMLLFLALMVTIRKCPLSYVWDFGPYVCIPLMIFAFCLLRMIDLADWQTKPVSPLDTLRGLDYGTGMAYSYYYGYLRVILPSTGTVTKGIVEKIENFEDNHNVTFPVHKMFILIPSSGYIPPDLKEMSHWMESAHELEEETRNRAGTIRRRYHNSVYKIYPDGLTLLASPKYVVMEGATPLLTYYEVQKHNHPESVLYQQYKKEIIKMFYKKLREIVGSEPDTRDLCELIYYDDFDAHGAKVNVAKIILERISEIGKLNVTAKRH